MCIEDEDLLLQEVLEIFDADLPILVSVCRWNQIATARPCSETMQPNQGINLVPTECFAPPQVCLFPC
jgi:hypothetical protein